MDDESLPALPSPLDKRPRLSPLAARAALAAAVHTETSLFQTKPAEKQSQKSAGSRKRPNPRPLGKNEETNIHESEILTGKEPQERNKRVIRQRVAKKRDSSVRSPAVSFDQSNCLSPIKESLLENQWETPSDKKILSKTSTPLDVLEDTTFRERTNTSKESGQQHLAATKTVKNAAKSAGRKASEIRSLRSSARLRKESSISATPLPEANDGTHSTAETKDNSTIQPESDAIETYRRVKAGTKKTKSSLSIRSSRSKMCSQPTSAIEGKSGVEDVGLSKAKEGRVSSEIINAEAKIQDTRVTQSNEENSKKGKSIRKADPNKRSTTADIEPSCSNTLQSEEQNAQMTLREDMLLPGASIDVTVELVTDVQEGEICKNSTPHRLKLRTRKISFDALPVGFGLGITGWLPSPSPPPPPPTVPLQAQHSPSPPCEADPERVNTLNLHFEAAVPNIPLKIDTQKSKKTGRKKAAGKSQGVRERLEGRSKSRVAGASDANENVHLASDGGKKSPNSILVSVFSGQNDPSESGATSVAMVKRESVRRSIASPTALKQEGSETTQQPDPKKRARKTADRPVKRTRKVAAL